MGLPWDSHSHWDTQSHAHLYRVRVLGDDWSRGQCVAARRSSGIDVALSSTDIISAEFHRINNLIIVSLRSLEGLSDNALVC